MRKPDTPSRMNALLLSLAAHALLILIASLFVVTKEVETDFLQVEWVKLPRTMRRIKTMEVKPVQPRVIKPKALSTPRVTPTAKPLDVKAAASLSAAHVGHTADVSLDTPQAGAIGEVKTDTEQAIIPHEPMLTRGAKVTWRVTLLPVAQVRARAKDAWDNPWSKAPAPAKARV